MRRRRQRRCEEKEQGQISTDRKVQRIRQESANTLGQVTIIMGLEAR